MPGLKTNEIEGTRAVLRYSRMSAYKAREVLDLIRGQDVDRAAEILRFSERDAARVVGKLLHSAVANAQNNDEMDPEELYVSSCYADEGATIKRWRPRARGRATRIRKRTCHITVIVSRLPDDRLERQRARQAADRAVRRARRVAGQRQSEARRRRGGAPAEAGPVSDETATDETATDETATDGTVTDGTVATETTTAQETAGAAEAAEEAGIVDQQAAAVEAAQEEEPGTAAGEPAPGATEEEGS